jgi:hypothetical protein
LVKKLVIKTVVSVTMPSVPAFETAALSRGSAACDAWTIGR